jgi:hypothetical protein
MLTGIEDAALVEFIKLKMDANAGTECPSCILGQSISAVCSSLEVRRIWLQLQTGRVLANRNLRNWRGTDANRIFPLVYELARTTDSSTVFLRGLPRTLR